MPRGPQASVPAPFSLLGIHHTTICAFCQSGSLNIPHKQNLSRYQKRLSSNGTDGDLNDDNEGRETHTLRNPNVTRLQEAYVRKVIDTLNDNDHIRPWDSDPSWVWKNLMRGNQFILMDHYMDFRMGAPDRPDPKHDPTRRAMGFARALAERVDLAAFEPHAELSSTKHCLARPGKEYLAYQPDAKGAKFMLKIEPGAYRIRWIQCATNECSNAKRVEVKEAGWIPLIPPFRGAAVAHLDRE